MKAKDLPENMRKMTLVQREAYVLEMQKKRAGIQTQLNGLNTKRQVWCADEMKKRRAGKGASFEHAVRKSVRTQAESKGLKFQSAAKAAGGKAPGEGKVKK